MEDINIDLSVNAEVSGRRDDAAEHLALPVAVLPDAQVMERLSHDRALLDLVKIVYATEDTMNEFIELEKVETNMTGDERMRLIGAVVRNFGFIEKARDIALSNPDFLPTAFNPLEFAKRVSEYVEVRQLNIVLTQFQHAVYDCLLLRSDQIYRLALRIYNNLKEMAKAKLPGAQTLYDTLRGYFKTRRKAGDKPPTEEELERHIHSLLHGTADGDISIHNEMPRVTSGKRVIIDNIHKGKAEFKESESGEIED